MFVINKIDLAPVIRTSPDAMDRAARKMRGERPCVLNNLKNNAELDKIVEYIERQGMSRP